MEIMLRYERYRFCPTQVWRPATDVYESPDEVVIIVELAGMNEDDINVMLSGNRLRIWGIRSDPAHSPLIRFHQMEIDHGVFERELFLTTPINQEDVSVTYKQGILRIRLPKVREVSGE